MSQDPNRHEEEPAASTTGGLPPDFFEVPEVHAADQSPAIISSERPLPPRKPTAPPPPQVVIDRRASFPVVFVVLASNVLFFVAGGLAGWALTRKGLIPSETAPPATAPNPLLAEVARSVETKAPKSALNGLESDVGALKSEARTLARELARLEGRLDTRPAAAGPVPPDLAPLQTKVDDLAAASRKLAPLATSVHALGERVEALDKRLDAIHADVSGLPKHVDASLAPLKAEAASRATREKVNPTDGARELGAALFREGKYAAARDVFLNLVQNDSDDARLWYFAALSNGLTTTEWTGDTERLVRRGVEREKAGTPARAEIEAQFSALKREQGKDWLKDWRNRALPR